MPAAARDFPYYIRGCDFGAGDCSFSSLAQFKATASGRDAYCEAKPYFDTRRTCRSTQSPIPKEILMRVLALVILAIGAASAAAPAQAQTYDPNYPVCLHVYGRITYYDCSTLRCPSARCRPRAARHNARSIRITRTATSSRRRVATSAITAATSARAIPVRPPGRRPATPAGPSGRPVPCCGSRSASRPLSP